MFYAIGFPMNSTTIWYDLAEAALEKGESQTVPYGDDYLTVYRWDVGEGIEVVAVESDPEEHNIVALFPAFRARQSETVQMMSLTRNPAAPVGYLAFDFGSEQVSCFLTNLLTATQLPRPNKPTTLRLCGLAESINLIWENPASGLLSLQDQGQESDPAWVDFNGRVEEYATITNPASGGELLWMRLAIDGVPDLEVVTTVENVAGTPVVGQMAAGRCWLQGQVEEAE